MIDKQAPKSITYSGKTGVKIKVVSIFNQGVMLLLDIFNLHSLIQATPAGVAGRFLYQIVADPAEGNAALDFIL